MCTVTAAPHARRTKQCMGSSSRVNTSHSLLATPRIGSIISIQERDSKTLERVNKYKGAAVADNKSAMRAGHVTVLCGLTCLEVEATQRRAEGARRLATASTTGTLCLAHDVQRCCASLQRCSRWSTLRLTRRTASLQNVVEGRGQRRVLLASVGWPSTACSTFENGAESQKRAL